MPLAVFLVFVFFYSIVIFFVLKVKNAGGRTCVIMCQNHLNGHLPSLVICFPVTVLRIINLTYFGDRQMDRCYGWHFDCIVKGVSYLTSTKVNFIKELYF